MTNIFMGLALGLVTNLAAEIFLNTHAAERPHNVVRVLRWICVCVGLLLASCLTASVPNLITLCLFTVSAATDFETKYLPPDGFTLGAVIVGIALKAWDQGIFGLRDAVVAQAICFAATTLAVALFNLCDSGDIKLAMLFGTACGNLPTIVYSVLGTWIAVWGVVLLANGLHGLRTRSLKDGLKFGLTLRPPLGPLLWVGLLAALIGQRLWLTV